MIIQPAHAKFLAGAVVDHDQRLTRILCIFRFDPSPDYIINNDEDVGF